jgi:predicted enzyme related to lactoylglutathione lyase
MNQGIEVIVYPVSNLEQAKTLYRTLLGVDPYVDQAYYVGFRVGDQDIGLDPHGRSKGITGPIVYVSVADIQSSLKQLLEAGAQPLQAVQDVGEGKLIASVKDADGNNIGLIKSLEKLPGKAVKARLTHGSK